MKKITESQQLTPTLEWIYSDPLALSLLKFISARTKRSQNRETYAAAYLSNENELVAIGRNMQVKRQEQWRVLQGYANHAEMMAFSSASVVYPEITQGIIYVIGFLADNQVFIRSESEAMRFSCSLCGKALCQHHIDAIALPTTNGWKQLDATQALETALKFEKENKKNKKSVARTREQVTIPKAIAQQLLEEIIKIEPLTLLSQLEHSYGLHPLFVELLLAAKQGYVPTNKYKSIVFGYRT